MLHSAHGYCEIEKESGRKRGKYFIVKGKNTQGKQQNFNNPHERFHVFHFCCWPYPQIFFTIETFTNYGIPDHLSLKPAVNITIYSFGKFWRHKIFRDPSFQNFSQINFKDVLLLVKHLLSYKNAQTVKFSRLWANPQKQEFFTSKISQ